MIKSRKDSTIEIWSCKYINEVDKRYEEDEEAIIIQIEHAINNDYIVEILRPDKKEGEDNE